MELKVTVYFNSKNDKTSELTLDGFYNEVFRDVVSQSNVDELLALGLLSNRADLSKFTPDPNHENLIAAGYDRDEYPEAFNDYKEVNLVEAIDFYKKLRVIADSQRDKLKSLDYSNLRDYYLKQLDSLINAFESYLENDYVCYFTVYAS